GHRAILRPVDQSVQRAYTWTTQSKGDPMFTPVPLPQQLPACANDPLRVLVVGAGIGGTTAAQLLRSRGLHPVLIDRMTTLEDAGYLLALRPMVDAAIDELGVRDSYVAASTHIDRYRVLNHRGQT